MLESFTISHKTDGDTACRIHVEPAKRRASATITIGGRIVATTEENNLSCKAFTTSDWESIDNWDQMARALAKVWSPFWRGISAA